MKQKGSGLAGDGLYRYRVYDMDGKTPLGSGHVYAFSDEHAYRKLQTVRKYRNMIIVTERLAAR